MNVLNLMAIFAVVTGSAHGYEFVEPLEVAEFSLSQQIRDALEGAKNQMPCGFLGIDVPPLAPLKIPHLDINVSNGDLTVNGTVDNLLLAALEDFKIEDVNVNILRSRLNLKLIWNHVSLQTLYNLNVELVNNDGEIGAHRTGSANIDLKGLDIQADIKYSLNIIRRRLKLKELKIRVTLTEFRSDIKGLVADETLNRVINDMIEELVLLGINDNTENIAQLTNDKLMPIINKAIGDKSINDIIGGGEGPTEPCDPKEEEL